MIDSFTSLSEGLSFVRLFFESPTCGHIDLSYVRLLFCPKKLIFWNIEFVLEVHLDHHQIAQNRLMLILPIFEVESII